jgi:hypothetical protein
MQLSLLIRNSSSIVAMVELGVLGIGYHQQWLSHIISYFQQNNQYSNSMSEGREHWLTKRHDAVATKVKAELQVRTLCTFDVSHF